MGTGKMQESRLLARWRLAPGARAAFGKCCVGNTCGAVLHARCLRATSQCSTATARCCDAVYIDCSAMRSIYNEESPQHETLKRHRRFWRAAAAARTRQPTCWRLLSPALACLVFMYPETPQLCTNCRLKIGFEATPSGATCARSPSLSVTSRPLSAGRKHAPHAGERAAAAPHPAVRTPGAHPLST